MNSLKKKKALLILLLLTLSLAVPRIPLIRLTASSVTQGNWVVTGTQVVQNESIDLNGNLTVEAGGNLTLRNTILIINSSFDGKYGVLVSGDASIYIYNTTITRAAGSSAFFFVDAGSNFVMESSQISGTGWCTPPNEQFASADYCVGINPNAGPLVESNGAVIRNDTFTHNIAGLILSGNNLDVQGNYFFSNDLSAMGVEQSDSGIFRNNTFVQNPELPYDDYIVEFNGGQDNSFVDNKVSVNQTYVAANPQIVNENWRLDGVKLNNSPNNVVADNNITAANVAVVEAQSWDCNVTSNYLTYGENGVALVPDDINSRVIGNTLIATSFHGGGATFGIWADISHNSVIANNTLTANWDPQTKIGGLSYGIYLDHTSNSSIVNNIMNLEQAYTYFSIALLTSSNDSILSNTFSGATFGAVLVGSSNWNLIADNNILADHSITLLGSSNNVIDGNNFRDLNGPSGGPFDNGVNQWSNGTEGNYWTFYTGTNQYGDGYGSSQYVRNAVPPNGTEPVSVSLSFSITGVQVPVLKPKSVPSSGSFQNMPLIKGQVLQITSGELSGNITIVNSTLYLAKDGTVAIGANGGSITIENSTLIDQGYGFSLACRGGEHCPTTMTIVNSTLSGAFLNDINIQNLTITGSRILNAQGDRAVSMENAENVFIENNTVSGELNGIFTYCDPAISNKLLESGNTILNIIDTAMQVCVSRTPSIIVAGNSIEGVLGNGIEINSNALVQGNTIEDCDGSAILVGGSSNTLVGNSFADSGTGIMIEGSGNLIYQNNFIGDINPAYAGGSNSWYHDGQGNYWSSYSGKDSNLDGVGDLPFVSGGVNDEYPYMQPSGWLIGFYLTIETNLPSSTGFSINGSSFDVGNAGMANLRLGYEASYAITLPQSVSLSNGSRLVFVDWGNGLTTPTRTVRLSSNSTLTATYALQAAIATTTTASSSSKTGASSTASSSISTTQTTGTASTAGSSSTGGGGGIPEFPFSIGIASVFVFVVVGAYVFLRRRTVA